MTILFIIIAIAFTIQMLILMVRPFLATRRDQLSFELLDEELREIEALVARKVSLVQALRDIEYDWKTDKISKEDYERFKQSCERQAVGVMRRLDTIHGGSEDWDAVIDRAVEQRLDALVEQDSEASSSHAPDDDSTGDSASNFDCNSCGASLADDDRFCSKCGTPVDATGGESLSSTATDDLELHSRSARPSEVAG